MTELTNVALDLIFEPRGATTKRANVNLQTSGTDISNRYMQPSEGGTATAANTNLQSSGSDISTLFTEIGTNSTAFSVTIAPSPANGSCNHFGGGCTASSNPVATAIGGTESYTYAWTKVSGVTFSLSAGATATPAMTTSLDGINSAVYRCTVDDGVNPTVFADVSITLSVISNN